MVTEGTNNTAEAAKVALDTLVNIAAKATQASQIIRANHQKLLQDSFEVGHKDTQTYLERIMRN